MAQCLTRQCAMNDETLRLTNKQQAFCDAYVGEARFNATKAALMAGYSKRSAHTSGWELLQKPEIAARVKQSLEARAMSSDAVLSELADIASADWREFLIFKTNPKTGETLEVKMDLSAKVRSLELLAKAHGLLKENVSVSALIGIYSFDGIPEDTP